MRYQFIVAGSVPCPAAETIPVSDVRGALELIALAFNIAAFNVRS